MLECQLYICTIAVVAPVFADSLLYTAGDYIRYIRDDDGDKMGYGLNLRTLRFGKFDVCTVQALEW